MALRKQQKQDGHDSGSSKGCPTLPQKGRPTESVQNYIQPQLNLTYKRISVDQIKATFPKGTSSHLPKGAISPTSGRGTHSSIHICLKLNINAILLPGALGPADKYLLYISRPHTPTPTPTHSPPHTHTHAHQSLDSSCPTDTHPPYNPIFYHPNTQSLLFSLSPACLTMLSLVSILSHSHTSLDLAMFSLLQHLYSRAFQMPLVCSLSYAQLKCSLIMEQSCRQFPSGSPSNATFFFSFINHTKNSGPAPNNLI